MRTVIMGETKSHEEGDEGSCVEVGGGAVRGLGRTRKKKEVREGGKVVMCKAHDSSK